MKTKAQKDFERTKEVAQAIVAIKSQREGLEGLAKDYFEYAQKAAQMGQDDFVDELLESIVDLQMFAEDLQYLELKVEMAAVTAQTMKELKKLPEVLKIVNTIFCDGPNFKKLGKDMASLFGTLKTAREQLREFRLSLGKTKDPLVSKLFGERYQADMEDPKRKERVQTKKRELEASLALGDSAANPVPAPADASAGVSVNEAAGIDDIVSMMDGEKKGN